MTSRFNFLSISLQSSVHLPNINETTRNDNDTKTTTTRSGQWSQWAWSNSPRAPAVKSSAKQNETKRAEIIRNETKRSEVCFEVRTMFTEPKHVFREVGPCTEHCVQRTLPERNNVEQQPEPNNACVQIVMPNTESNTTSEQRTKHQTRHRPDRSYVTGVANQ